MTKEDQATINALIATSTPFMVVEWRGYGVETIKYVDKKTGKAAEFSFIQHTVETLAGKVESLKAQEELRKDETPENVKRDFRKGDQVLIVVREFTNSKGEKKIRVADMKQLQAEPAAK